MSGVTASGSSSRTDLAEQPLAGFTIAITADRRREELAALLQRRGAKVMLAPALRIVPLTDDTELRTKINDAITKMTSEGAWKEAFDKNLGPAGITAPEPPTVDQ